MAPLAERLQPILDTAVLSAGADFGNIQLHDARTGVLTIVAQRGFSEDWLSYWNSQRHDAGACGTSLAKGKRVVVEDIVTSHLFVGHESLEVQLKEGLRAVQSTPLFSGNGELLGVFSTHYRKPWKPTASSLATLDSLSLMAALTIAHGA